MGVLKVMALIFISGVLLAAGVVIFTEWADKRRKIKKIEKMLEMADRLETETTQLLTPKNCYASNE